MKAQRMCVACKEMKEKEQLFRVVKSKDTVFVDPTFRASGRGAYICRSTECIKNAQKRGAFDRSLSIRINPEIYSALEAFVENAE